MQRWFLNAQNRATPRTIFKGAPKSSPKRHSHPKGLRTTFLPRHSPGQWTHPVTSGRWWFVSKIFHPSSTATAMRLWRICWGEVMMITKMMLMIIIMIMMIMVVLMIAKFLMLYALYTNVTRDHTQSIIGSMICDREINIKPCQPCQNASTNFFYHKAQHGSCPVQSLSNTC